MKKIPMQLINNCNSSKNSYNSKNSCNRYRAAQRILQVCKEAKKEMPLKSHRNRNRAETSQQNNRESKSLNLERIKIKIILETILKK